jgi:hypothetical protein
MKRLQSLFRILGLISATALILAGTINLLFSAEGLLRAYEIEGGAAAWAVLGLIFAAHLAPFLLLAYGWGQEGPRSLDFLLVLVSPFVGWYGLDSLILHGDWGDAVLWLPYLVTGGCLFLVGIIGALRRLG